MQVKINKKYTILKSWILACFLSRGSASPGVLLFRGHRSSVRCFFVLLTPPVTVVFKLFLYLSCFGFRYIHSVDEWWKKPNRRKYIRTTDRAPVHTGRSCVICKKWGKTSEVIQHSTHWRNKSLRIRPNSKPELANALKIFKCEIDRHDMKIYNVRNGSVRFYARSGCLWFSFTLPEVAAHSARRA